MTHFLQNLIDRHQVDQLDRGNSETQPIVQPRPRARFESDLGVQSTFEDNIIPINKFESDSVIQEPESILNPLETITHSIPVAEPKPVLPDVDGVQQNSGANPIISNLVVAEDLIAPLIQHQTTLDPVPVGQTQTSSDTNGGIQHKRSSVFGDLNERIESLGIQPATQASALPTVSTAEKNEHQAIKPQALIAESSNQQNLLLTEALEQRIQSILERLNNQQNAQSQQALDTQPDNQSTVKLQHQTALTTTENSLSMASVPLPLMAASPNSVPKVKALSPETRIEQPLSAQAGLLQTPDWLTTLQTDLNNRLQALQNQAQIEPVINVTIGRVDVRAVKATTTPASKAKPKTSAVMSLDDYLKQRQKA